MSGICCRLTKVEFHTNFLQVFDLHLESVEVSCHVLWVWKNLEIIPDWYGVRVPLLFPLLNVTH